LRYFYQIERTATLSLAETEYEKFRIIQDKLLESDFDKIVKK
jgi:hypothetical protein